MELPNFPYESSNPSITVKLFLKASGIFEVVLNNDYNVDSIGMESLVTLVLFSVSKIPSRLIFSSPFNS